MSVLSLQYFTATQKGVIQGIMLCTAVVTTAVMTGCASKPQVNYAKRYAKAPDFYTIQSGDTLSGIAARYGLNYINIAEMNDIAAPYRIFVGQSIRLKDKGQRTTTVQAMTQAEPIQRQSIAVPTPVVPATPAVVTPAITTKSVATPAVTPSVVKPVNSSPAVQATTGLKWVKPSSGAVLQGFNMANNIRGIRYGGQVGDPIYAAAAGQVVYAADGLKEYGNLVLIKHVDGYVSAYAHNSKMNVKSGDNVTAGQKIAEMGSSGATRTMLEFQVRLNGKPIDPATLLLNK